MNASARKDMAQTASPLKLTVVGAVPGQPFPFGTVGCSDDADGVTALEGQIVLTALGRHRYCCLVHGILLSCNLMMQ